MPRTLSAAARRAAFAAETGEWWVTLITLSHPSLPEPLRFCTDTVDTVSRGHTFHRSPIQVVLPDDSGDQTQTSRLTIDNLDQAYTQALRSITTPLTVLLEVVLASDPDTVEMSCPDLQLRRATLDDAIIDGELTGDGLVGEPFPAQIMAPSGFPGLF